MRSQINELMDQYTETAKRLLAPTHDRSIKVLHLNFYLTDPHLQSIGSAVSSAVEHGNTKHLEFIVLTELMHNVQWDEEDDVIFGQRFMSFFSSYPHVFRWLKSLSIQNMRLNNESDVPNLLDACDQLQRLRIESCDSGRQSLLRSTRHALSWWSWCSNTVDTPELSLFRSLNLCGWFAIPGYSKALQLFSATSQVFAALLSVVLQVHGSHRSS
ncbi:hypothetical protein ACP70R_024502 [Stipagrostis hirtigluma subsp. patula]